jgi:hypothetical protein
MITNSLPIDPLLSLINAKRLTRKASGLSTLLLGLVCGGLSASGLMFDREDHLSWTFLVVFLVVYFAAPSCLRRWRARHGQPDIRSTVALTFQGSWWRWKSLGGSAWEIHPLDGIFILATAVLTKLLLVKSLGEAYGTGGDWFALAIALNYLLISRSLRMGEDLLMGLGLGLIGLTAMILPSTCMHTTVRWAWVGIGLLMIVNGASRHVRWRRWVAEHGIETP